MRRRAERLRGPALAVAAALAAGCATYAAYDGPARPAAELAVVRADPAFSAGLPVQVILRKVDDRPVDARHAAVQLLPGRHAFLVDCRLAAEGTTTRFTVEGEVEAGREYRLEATASARSCEAVSLILRGP